MKLLIASKLAMRLRGCPKILCYIVICSIYIVISSLEEYFRAYRHSGALYKIVQNFKFMIIQKHLDLMRSVSVHDFKNVSLFPSYVLLQNSI